MGEVEGHGVTRGLSPTICNMGLEVLFFFFGRTVACALYLFKKIDALLLL